MRSNGKGIKLGCEVLVDGPPSWFRSGRLGLLANQASFTGAFEDTAALIRKAGGKLHCLFSPQHGFFGDKQANMVESPHGTDPYSGIPVFSLYGETRQPTPEMLERIDLLLIDLPDVGTRVYTYGTTMGLCLEAAGRAGVKVVVLDRPNPINGNAVEGNIVLEGYRSFVGRYPIPMRHGLTMGELARFIVRCCSVDCELEVIPMKGWRRGDFHPDTGLQWFFPSPNMPAWETALLYPGMVLLEGADLSEGRGTTLPFHLFGAPYLDQREFLEAVKRYDLEGVAFRPVCFEPVFDKWKGRMCRGFQIHVTDRERIRPYRLGLALLQTMLRIHPDHFRWLPPPYEYEWEKLPMDILLGDGELRRGLERGDDPGDLEAAWQPGLEVYEDLRGDCLLYGA